MASSVTGTMGVRRAEFHDLKALNQAVTDNGGLPVYKASFGAFNFNSVIENSALMLTANVVNEESEVSIAVLSLNDSVSLMSTDSTAFARTIDALKEYIPVTVSVVCLFVNYWCLCESRF
jgi:hypothetical protein